jgi:hypothetical protein
MSKKAVDELFHNENKDEVIEVKEAKPEAEKSAKAINDNNDNNDNKLVDNKSDKENQPKEQDLNKAETFKETKEQSTDIEKYKADIAKLQKESTHNKRWGQEKNQSYILAKKRIDKLAEDWLENGLLDDEGSKALCSIFSNNDADDDIPSVKADEDNVYNLITEKLKKELPLYKKYAKDEKADDNINAFFSGFSLLPEKEQKDLLEYLKDADGSDALDRAIVVGADFNETIGVGIKKHGDILAYVKSLNLENKKLQEKVSKISKELDNRYGSVDTRGITTRAGYSDKKEEPQDAKKQLLSELFG